MAVSFQTSPWPSARVTDDSRPERWIEFWVFRDTVMAADWFNAQADITTEEFGSTIPQWCHSDTATAIFASGEIRLTHQADSTVSVELSTSPAIAVRQADLLSVCAILTPELNSVLR